ncbi:MAG: SsrA-binding protein SmpB [Bacteroidota bacterium]
MASGIEIKYKKATFSFLLFDKYVAGIVLTGTEIKSVRQGQVNFNDPFCIFRDDELWIKGMHIAVYSHGNIFNHEPLRERKLLLNRRELNKLEKKVKEKGFTIIPTRCFISEKGYAKVEIALARGKKTFDKREDIKKKDSKRNMDRLLKI